MKRNLILTSIVVFVLSTGNLSAAAVKLQVLNPRGEITLPPIVAPSARLADFAGRKIGLYWNEKAGGDHFWNGIEQALKQKLPGGIPGYSFSMNYWREGLYAPTSDQTKLIRGATLTKADH
jgi:hypothetical protein